MCERAGIVPDEGLWLECFEAERAVLRAVRQLAFRDYLHAHADAAAVLRDSVERQTSAHMNDSRVAYRPVVIEAILDDTAALGFNMASDAGVGALLAVLASSKPGGRFLEIGTGTGHGTAWILSGMDAASTLDTVDNDAGPVAVAQRHLGRDSRVRFHVMDGEAFLRDAAGSFDVIYADAWPGKFSHLDEALALLAAGGLYVIDDLLPQPNWPEGHAAKIPPLVADLERRPGFSNVRLDWATGVMLMVRRPGFNA
jgi:predicted O-methyltransferase YrrM